MAIRKARHSVSRTAGLYPGIDDIRVAQLAWLQHWFGSCTPTNAGGSGISPTKLNDRSQLTVLKTVLKSSAPTDAGGLSAPVSRKIESVARRKKGDTHCMLSAPRSVVPCINLPV